VTNSEKDTAGEKARKKISNETAGERERTAVFLDYSHVGMSVNSTELAPIRAAHNPGMPSPHP
jgi:hypothetical protein